MQHTQSGPHRDLHWEWKGVLSGALRPFLHVGEQDHPQSVLGLDAVVLVFAGLQRSHVIDLAARRGRPAGTAGGGKMAANKDLPEVKVVEGLPLICIILACVH